ncbi:hypothetical protein SLS56_004556 [Neofusicoccum ribis]|uniref:Uncharacterized protein n=1 Tax=Neofusicoccum ribis TaxID=45134 RepID=A0ABR3SW82_9PEZI
MGSPVEDPADATFSDTDDEYKRAASAPVIDSDKEPLLTAQERNRHHLPQRASDGQGSSIEEDETKLRWPVRHYSASSDPLTRDRRIKRLGTFIDKAKEKGTTRREPLRKPSDGGSVRRVRTAPTPVRRRSSNLLWLTRPRSRDSGAESILRRVGHHIKARSQPEGDSPIKTPSEEEPSGSSRSAPEVPAAKSSSSSPGPRGPSPASGNDAITPDEDLDRKSSPTGLDRVNTKLEEWTFAARECTAQDTSRSHPHFRPYVEVFQDDDEPQFNMEDDDSLFMAPPNSERPTPNTSTWSSRRASEVETDSSNASSPSPNRSYSLFTCSSEGQHEPDDEDEDDVFARRGHINSHTPLIIPSGYYSPRPNKLFTFADRFDPLPRSLSNLSNTSDMSENATSLLTNHRDSIDERDQDEIELPVGNPWSHRDSVAIAKERIRKKHLSNESGEAFVGGVGILKGVRRGDVERTAPLAIPRMQQITFMGALSPILDSSPPNAGNLEIEDDLKIDDLAGRA